MIIDLPIGAGKTVQVRDPQRNEFPDTLGGAVEYTIAHWVFSVLRVMGEGLGEFAAGLLVRFLARIEPSCVTYMRPLMDMLLDVEDLPPKFREFLNELRSPKKEVGGALLSTLGTTIVGSVTGSIVGSMLSSATYHLNRKMRPARPSPAEAYTLFWRGAISSDEMVGYLADQGYPPSVLQGFGEILRPRLDGPTWMESYRRGYTTWAFIEGELTKRGFSRDDIGVLYKLVTQLIDPERVIQAWWRKEYSDTQAIDKLKQHGYTAEDAKMLLNLSLWIPGTGDLVRMAVREAFSDDVAARFGYDEDFPKEFAYWLERQGGSADWAKRFWRAHWDLPSVQMGYEMLHRGVIDQTTLLLLLRVSDIPAFWRDKLMKISYSPLTRVDVRRMYGLGVLNRDEVKRSYLDLGYDETNAERLTEFTIRYEAPDDKDKNEQNKSLTASLIVQGYRKGIYDRTEALLRLQTLKYTAEDAEFLLALEDAKKTIDTISDPTPEYQRDIKSMVERGYAQGYLDDAEATKYLTKLGYSSSECLLILAAAEMGRIQNITEQKIDIIREVYVNRSIDRSRVVQELGKLNVPSKQQDRLLETWDMQRELRPRRLTESQYRKCLGQKLIDQAQYEEAMRGLGYTESDIKLLVAMATTE